jgi:hypothetical protein
MLNLKLSNTFLISLAAFLGAGFALSRLQDIAKPGRVLQNTGQLFLNSE